jgi:hypothetical protein
MALVSLLIFYKPAGYKVFYIHSTYLHVWPNVLILALNYRKLWQRIIEIEIAAGLMLPGYR